MNQSRGRAPNADMFFRLAVGLGLVLLIVACSGKSDGSKPLAARCSTEFTFAPQCTCSEGAEDCPLDCNGETKCGMTCRGYTGLCSARCGDECTFKCSEGPRCDAACGNDCIVSCTATDSCTGACGALCNYTCEGARDCSPTVGDGSQVRCTGTSSCNVTCTGKCQVRCDKGKDCNVTCPDGAAKKTCSDGFACGIDCT